MFVSPTKGTPFDVAQYAKTLRLALAKAEIEKQVEPFRDGRRTSITNAAASATPPVALMAAAGHTDFKTQIYIKLAGQTFREEAERLEERISWRTSTKSWYRVEEPSPAS